MPATIGYRVTYRRDADGERLPEGQAAVIASDHGQPVGVLRWDFCVEPPMIVGVTVEESHRRRGIATAMLDVARFHESRLTHSATLTADGRAWTSTL